MMSLVEAGFHLACVAAALPGGEIHHGLHYGELPPEIAPICQPNIFTPHLEIQIVLPAEVASPVIPPEIPPQVEPTGKDNLALVFIQPSTNIDEFTVTIEKAGGHITQVFPGKAVIAEVPQEAVTSLGENIAVFRQQLTTDELKPLTEEQQHLALAWNDFLSSPEPTPEAQAQVAEALVNDALTVPSEERPIHPAEATNQPTFYETSVYMAHKIAVGIVLPESDDSLDPSTENWTPGERAKVLSEIMASLQWWANREPRANLTFWVDDGTVTPIATSYEPIIHPYGYQAYWIPEVMTRMGYGGASYFEQVYNYNNALRHQKYNTDWAFTIFVVDSSNDADGKFLDGYFAYAYLGGPFMVMTYGNDGYGPQNMDVVSAHEIGHIFLALDQYSSAYQPCTRKSGYLGVENQNSQYHPSGSCLSDVASIMRGQIYPYTIGAVDPYARGQLGWQEAFRRNPVTGLWEPNPPDNQYKTLDVGDGYYGSVITSTERITATVDLQSLPLELTAWDHVIDINALTYAWILNNQGQVISPILLDIQPDGHLAQAVFAIPLEQQQNLRLCARGLFGGDWCQPILARLYRLFLPIIEKEHTP